MTVLTKTDTLPKGTWQIDATHSQVGFAVDYMGGTFRGTFAPIEGTLTVPEDGRARLEGSAKAEAVRVQDENLEAHLLSPEFFDAEETPQLLFRSREIERSGDEVRVAGELTIKGISQPVELRGGIGEPIADPYARTRVVLTLATTVDRTDFGLDWNVPLPSGEPALATDVAVSAELYLIQGQE
jgi:polyisoprenoid-binding protein YceI